MDYDFGFPFEILNERKRESAVLNKEDLNYVMNYLCTAFDWDMTNEGDELWSDIYESLLRIKYYGN